MIRGQDVSVDDGWLPSLRDLHATYSGLLTAMAAEQDPVMHPAALASAVAGAMPHDSLAVFDGGHTSFWSNDLTPVHEARTRFHDPGMAHLGFGLPYAMAMQLTDPDRPVFNITGDGGFGFTLQELDTARRYQLPVVTVIHNNESWGVIRQGQSKQFDFEFGTGLEGTDYAADRSRVRLPRRTRVGCRRSGAGDRTRPGERPSLGDRLPHPIRPPPGDGGVRKHEPLRFRRAHRGMMTWPT